MPDVLAAIEAAYDAAPRVKVTVPEWGDVDLYFDKVVTVQRRKVARAGCDPKDDAELFASYIMHEAQNEDGTRVFEPSAKTRAVIMGKTDTNVLMRIMMEIPSGETVDDAKNV